MPAVAFNSGNFEDPNHALTLKLAYHAGTYWQLALLDELNSQDCAVGGKGDVIYVLHSHSYGPSEPIGVWLERVWPGR